MSDLPSISPTLASDSHIETSAETCGGKPRIAGSRIRVQDIVVWHERMGLSVDEIVSRYPHLTLAGVYAALTYYHDHREQIDSEMAAGDQLVEEMRRLHPSKLQAKLAADE